MIDEAEALNSKRPNEMIGFMSREDDELEDEEDEDGDVFASRNKSQSSAALRENYDRIGRAERDDLNDSEEEKGSNPELSSQRKKLSSGGDPFSASQKIAAMGLGYTASEADGLKKTGSSLTPAP